jgi:hypothetical protein
MDLVVDPTGLVYCVYDEALDLATLGRPAGASARPR